MDREQSASMAIAVVAGAALEVADAARRDQVRE